MEPNKTSESPGSTIAPQVVVRFLKSKFNRGYYIALIYITVAN